MAFFGFGPDAALEVAIGWQLGFDVDVLLACLVFLLGPGNAFFRCGADVLSCLFRLGILFSIGWLQHRHRHIPQAAEMPGQHRGELAAVRVI